jgi:hypothetical protein
MLNFDNFKEFANKNKYENNNLLKHINTQIDGRICLTDYLHYLLSLKSYMGDQCKTYVEIGTLWGGSIISLMNLKDNHTKKFIGIDLFTGYYNKPVKKNGFDKTSQNINETNHLEFTTNNIQKLNKYNKNFTLVKGSSYSIETVQKLKKITKSIDLLFIDGDHSEYGVTQDFLEYKDLVSKSGIIVFDNYGQPNHWEGVKKGVDKINFSDYGFEIKGQLGYSLFVEKII